MHELSTARSSIRSGIQRDGKHRTTQVDGQGANEASLAGDASLSSADTLLAALQVSLMARARSLRRSGSSWPVGTPCLMRNGLDGTEPKTTERRARIYEGLEVRSHSRSDSRSSFQSPMLAAA